VRKVNRCGPRPARKYLELTDEEMQRWGPLAKVSPPLRDQEANEGPWTHLAAGRIQALGSDHSPHSRETKAEGYSNIFDCGYGGPGRPDDAGDTGGCLPQTGATITFVGPCSI
jgi:hypothetical protein